MWRLRYSLEAAGYIADNWGMVRTLVDAIAGLRNLENAHPEQVRLEMDIFVWPVADHLVYYSITVEAKIIEILVIRPID